MQKTINSSALLFAVLNIGQLAFGLKLTVPPAIESNVAISIQATDTQTPLFSYRESIPMLYASNFKLVTSYVALKQFGPHFTWSTQLRINGHIHHGQLNGNVFVIGGGDPTLTSSDLTQLLANLTQLGIKQIEGNLIWDGSIFTQIPTSSELHPEPLAAYSSDPAGLIINSNLSNLSIAINGTTITAVPSYFGRVKLNSQLHLSPNQQPCPNLEDFVTLTQPNPKQLVVSGAIPAACNHRSLDLNLLNNHDYNQLQLMLALNNNSIKLKGKIMAGHALTRKSRLIATHTSPSLVEVINSMNKSSNNLYAKTIFLSLGALNSNNPAQVAISRQRYLQQLGIISAMPELSQLENGSGLSRFEKLTSEHMRQILSAIYHSQYYSVLHDSLPTPAESGTLQNKFPQFQQQLFAKTGSLSDTKAYSGYFAAQNGKLYLISFVLNAQSPAESNPFQFTYFDQLLESALTELNHQP